MSAKYAGKSLGVQYGADKPSSVGTEHNQCLDRSAHLSWGSSLLSELQEEMKEKIQKVVQRTNKL
jgi:hypothetical protein